MTLTPIAAKIARTNYDALYALRERMTPSDVAWDTINARVEEARQAMKGMPDNMITLGELHTAFRCVFDHGPVPAKRVGSAIQSSTVRAGNVLRQLEEKDLVRDHEGEWITTHNDLTPEEANAVFDAAFPGLGTTNKQRPPQGTKQRAQRAQPNKEATMATKETTTPEYTKDTSKQSGVKFEQVAKMIGALQKADGPVSFADLCDKVDAKYPQDVQAAFFALDIIGAVERYTYVDEGSTRSRIAYKWAATEDDAARPTKPTSTASRTRSRGSKKPEATPAAA